MQYRLDELFELQMGKTPSRNTNEYWNNGKHKWLSISDLSGTQKYTSTTKELLSDVAVQETGIKQIPANTVVMSFKLSLGKVAITSEPLYSNEAIMAFVDKKRCVIIPEYTYYYLKSLNWNQTGNKAVMGLTLNKKTLSAVTINVPPLEKQYALVEKLNQIESVIHSYNTQLGLLEMLIKSRFVEMFGNPVLNEKGFPSKSGKDIFKLSNGKFVSEERRIDDGVPVYGGNGISWHTDDCLVKNDTIIIGRVGFQSGNVHFASGPLWVSDNAMYISELLDKSYDLRFLYYLMKYIDFTRFQDAGDLKKITQRPFMEMDYIWPPSQMQVSFIDSVDQIDKSKSVVQKSLDEAQLLYDSLMQEFFG